MERWEHGARADRCIGLSFFAHDGRIRPEMVPTHSVITMEPQNSVEIDFQHSKSKIQLYRRDPDISL